MIGGAASKRFSSTVTHWALGHGCFCRSAGFGVGDIGIVRDRGKSIVAESDIGEPVTVLEADNGTAAVVGIGRKLERNIGQDDYGAPSAPTRPLAIEANAGPPRRPGSVAPPHRHRASGAESWPGMDAGLFWGPLFGPSFITMSFAAS